MDAGTRGDGRLRARLAAAWRALQSLGAGARATTAQTARFRLMYERFREILSLNDNTLQLIADIEDRLAGRAPFALEELLRRVRKAAMDVFVMVKDLNQISGNRHAQLYDTLRRLNVELEHEFPRQLEDPAAPFVLPLASLRAGDAAAAGSKMANLGEVMTAAGLAVPDGFVVTTAAFAAFMSANELWERAERLEGVLESHGRAALSEACHEVEGAIRAASVPPAIAGAIHAAYDELTAGAAVLVAVRSSAVGEDTKASHAGQYRSELDVARDGLLAAYRSVVASAYSPAAVSYRFERGMTAREEAMAVGCVRMLAPRCAGIMFSRPPDDPAGGAVVITAVPGVADGVASGEESALAWVVDGDRTIAPASSLLAKSDLVRLQAAARQLEGVFGEPQEIEWALAPDGSLSILQSRPMVIAPLPAMVTGEIDNGEPPILTGGLTACAGVASGPVVLVRGEADLETFPDGGVLVARHSSPVFSRVIARCAAIVTDVGSPTGHMASLAREFGVPAIVGAGRATSFLQPGELVTVDATTRRVLAGAAQIAPRERPPGGQESASPALQALRRIARFVTPLALTDPAGPQFHPAHCRSLHDITRFVHEKVFEVMFHFGDLASSDRQNARRLEVKLPIEVHVFDVGGGLTGSAPAAGAITEEHVSCAPMRPFLAGMLDLRLRWDKPRPLSARGFMSVLGQSIAGLPAESLKVGRASYAIISDNYMNFSTKAGYHFSTVDTYCGDSLNKNYIHFRFAGGAADPERRSRRVRFLSTVLTELDFRVQFRGDLLVARLEKFPPDIIRARLADLGRITMCARQLDMLMDSAGSPEFFARAFLAGEMERF